MGQSCLSSGYAPAGATVANSTFPSCWQIPHATIAGKRQAMLCVNTWAHAKKKTSSSKRSLSYNCSSVQADQPTFVHAGMADFTY